MSFTYDSTALSESLNHLRFLIQDTAEDGHFFEDEEISFAADQEANIYRAAAGLCRAIAAKFAQMPGYDGEIQLKTEEKAKTYLSMAKNYDEKADQIDDSMKNGTQSGMSFPTIGGDCEPTFTRRLHFS